MSGIRHDVILRCFCFCWKVKKPSDAEMGGCLWEFPAVEANKHVTFYKLDSEFRDLLFFLHPAKFYISAVRDTVCYVCIDTVASPQTNLGKKSPLPLVSLLSFL